ncbi:YciI family protein [Microbispora rosea]|uniref:YciI family protein n=1 Tax=Microbispora rosea TaxID=58117 RepID=UPI0034174B29
MQYALLAYNPAEDTDRAARPIPGALATTLDRPEVTGWARLHADGSATTLRNDEGRVLLTDGPFIDSKEYLSGLILIEADDLDGALATARELLGTTRPGTAIEVRPILDGRFRGA